MNSLDANYVESVLLSMARKIGIEVSRYRTFRDMLLKMIQYLERLEVDKELPITLEDILAFEEHLVDYVVTKLRNQKENSNIAEMLTPLARLYKDIFSKPTTVIDETAREFDEDKEFEHFITRSLGLRLRVSQLKTYLNYVIDLIDRVENP